MSTPGDIYAAIEAIWEVSAADRLLALEQYKALAEACRRDPLAYAMASAAAAEGVLRTAESQTAEAWLAEATRALPMEPPPFVLAQVRRAQAVVAGALGNPEAALQLATEACGHADAVGAPALQAKCFQVLGMLLSTSGMFEEALDAAFDARRAHVALGRQPPGVLENNIAILLSELGYLDRAWNYADLCVRVADGEGKPGHQGSALVTRGWAAYSAGRHADAVADYLEGLDVAGSVGNVQTLQVLNINLGSAYIGLGRDAEALAAFAEAEALLPRRPSRWLEAGIAMERAPLLEDAAAAKALRFARDGFDQIGRAAEAAMAAKRLYELARRRALWQEALEHHEDWTRRLEALAQGRRRRRTRATELRIEKELQGRLDADESEELDQVVRDLEATGEDLRARNRELELLAARDALTGLANRRAFDLRLAADLVRRSGAVSLAVIDVENFKEVNDTFGHAVGDQVLVRVASLLKEGRRVADVVARRGGDEFVLLLPGATVGAARSVARRILAAVRAEPWGTVAVGLRVTLSIGVAAAGEQDDPESLFDAADAALYASKGAGRDRVS